MIHPASDKRIALNVVAGGALQQGSVLKFAALTPDDGTGRLMAFKATAAADVSNFGCFLAYYITPDSQDIEYVGKPESADFTLNTGTGISGGVNTIASGTEFVALGGRGALIRLDKNALHGTPSTLTAYPASTILEVNSTSGLLDTVASGDINVSAAQVIANDGVTLVVMLA